MRIKDYQKNLNQMKQNLDFISELNRDIFKEIKDSKERDKYAEIVADTDKVIESMKKGDITELNKLQLKYADKNNKSKL